MAILVDAAIWPWRGQRWAHLISDTSLEELHAFTNDLGIRRLAFGGDHYDINTAERSAALGAGAVGTDAREIVGALRRSGLRTRPPHSDWHWNRIGEFRTVRPAAIGGLRHGLPTFGVGQESTEGAQWDAAGLFAALLPQGARVDVAVLDRRYERAVVISNPDEGRQAQLEEVLLGQGSVVYRRTRRGRTTTHELIAPRS